MALLANPFATLDPVPIDGLGINPLLLHPGMFIHPPVLMTGLIMVTVPFSFALGSLISKRTRDQWVDAETSSAVSNFDLSSLGLGDLSSLPDGDQTDAPESKK